jgi:hypothetical protein
MLQKGVFPFCNIRFYIKNANFWKSISSKILNFSVAKCNSYAQPIAKYERSWRKTRNFRNVLPTYFSSVSFARRSRVARLVKVQQKNFEMFHRQLLQNESRRILKGVLE